ncbi:unnamed protein product [marine sediment metagenome]|uniref:Uncharacterized protein n=1 Tax=marine sediment metagenome TaxID=412755 RepID=X1EBS3_9ZZZZ
MGWASGTTICINAWSDMRDSVPFNFRATALSCLIIALQNHDWDCGYEIKNEWPEAEEALQAAEAYWTERWKGRDS